MLGARFLAGAAIAGLAAPAAAQAPTYLSCTYQPVDQRADPATSVYRVTGGEVRLWLRERWQEPLDHCDPPTAETDALTRQFIAGTTCAITVDEREISGSAATAVEEIVARDSFRIELGTGRFTRTVLWEGEDGHFVGHCLASTRPPAGVPG